MQVNNSQYTRRKSNGLALRTCGFLSSTTFHLFTAQSAGAVLFRLVIALLK